MRLGHLVALAALDGGAAPVQPVDLQLHEVNLGVVGEHLLEHVGRVVEREAHPAHAAGALLLGDELEGVEALCHLVVVHVDVVGEVVVHVVGAETPQLLLEDGSLLGLVGALLAQLAERHLGRDGERVARVARHHGLAHGALAHVLVVHPRRIEVGEAAVDELVGHALEGRHVDLGVVLADVRQAHAAKAQLAGRTDLVTHGVPSPHDGDCARAHVAAVPRRPHAGG